MRRSHAHVTTRMLSSPSFHAFRDTDSLQPMEALMLHLIWSVIVGFIVGLIARAIMPGAEHMGFWMTSLVGIGGSLVGGLIGTVISRPRAGAMFHPAGFLMSIVGAIILLYAMRYVHV